MVTRHEIEGAGTMEIQSGWTHTLLIFRPFADTSRIIKQFILNSDMRKYPELKEQTIEMMVNTAKIKAQEGK